MGCCFSLGAACYLKEETENIATIISKAGDEVTEPLGVDFPFVMHNYRGLFTIFFFLMNHIFILLPVKGVTSPFLVRIIIWSAPLFPGMLELKKKIQN